MMLCLWNNDMWDRMRFPFFFSVSDGKRQKNLFSHRNKWFWPAKGMQSTCSLVQIHNMCEWQGKVSRGYFKSVSTLRQLVRSRLVKSIWGHGVFMLWIRISLRPGLVIPLRAKRVGEFIDIRHKQISPTRILSTLGCL